MANILNLVRVSAEGKIYLAVQNARLEELVERLFGPIPDVNVTNVADDYEVLPLGKSTIQFNVGGFDNCTSLQSGHGNARFTRFYILI